MGNIVKNVGKAVKTLFSEPFVPEPPAPEETKEMPVRSEIQRVEKRKVQKKAARRRGRTSTILTPFSDTLG